jgi:hypothetical protein
VNVGDLIRYPVPSRRVRNERRKRVKSSKIGTLRESGRNEVFRGVGG